MSSANGNKNRDDLLHGGTCTPRHIHSEKKLPANCKKCLSLYLHFGLKNILFTLTWLTYLCLSISNQCVCGNQRDRYAHLHIPWSVNANVCHLVNLSGVQHSENSFRRSSAFTGYLIHDTVYFQHGMFSLFIHYIFISRTTSSSC